MSETEDASELLFFDTFSHEIEDINLDLVQFPKPVYITQIRIIPLGARVQADFPGGVRLGATNPSTFDIEFFVNDLGIQNAPTFENLGHLKYNQNDCIHLETANKIATDGLVLRGWYSTITLAVYGITRTTLTDPIVSPQPQLDVIDPEDMCELTNENRTAGLPNEEEWKEPSDLPHKTRVSDYERDELEYTGDGLSRDNFHHQSGDERERRLRKTSPRHRTMSESNDREYGRSRSDRERERERDKSGREWSRSPEYSRRPRHKRSDAEDSHKWPPRTPPATIDSRPRSPDLMMDYADDDDMRYKLKARAYMRSRESLGGDNPTSAAPQDVQTINDDDETPGTPVEQFEPILSDDEIMGDEDSNAAADEFENELQAAADAAAANPAINTFDPYKMPVRKHTDIDLNRNSKTLENLRALFKKFEFQTKCSSLSAFMAANTSVDERENFVFLSEQLINQLSYLAQNFKQRNSVLHQLFVERGKDEDDTNNKQLEHSYNILQIALHFEAANAQIQPAFKTRHIKVGARLAELLGCCQPFVDYLLNVQHFDPFNALLKLYNTDYMALSIKLMLLKAIYALLDTKVGLHYFLNSDLRGYQLILETLQRSHLTRTKYALQAIIKKLNLYEALDCIRERSTQLFVLVNYEESSRDEAYTAIEQALELLLDAISLNGLSYQQPRRFLPVSKKFENVVDAGAQRSFEHTLQTFFKQQSLAESLLLLLSNAGELAISLLMRTLDTLRALLATHVGIDYLVDDAFETTEMLVTLLLCIEDVADKIEMDLDIGIGEKPLNTEIKTESVVKSEPPTKSLEETTNEINVKIEATEAKKQNEQSSPPPQPTAPPTEDENKESNDKSDMAPNDIEEEIPENVQKFLDNDMQKLGIELAYKVQTRYHLDAIKDLSATHSDLSATNNTNNNNNKNNSLIEHLHALYSQSCDSAAATNGRSYTVELLGLNNNLQILMDLIKKEKRLQTQQQQHSNKYKSPILMYTVDMVDCIVRHCENLNYLLEHGLKILELSKNHESFEPSVSAVLQEMYVYLKPLEAIPIFAYDDITPLVEVINRSLEYITTFPGDLIMAVRILRHLAIGNSNDTGGTYDGTKSSSNTEELRNRFVTLQFYAADGVQILLQILERLCTFFEQPGLHKPALRSSQGVHCCQIVLPTLEILRRMLSYAIQTRDVDYKDLTAIDPLMKTYFLLHHFPMECAAAGAVEKAKKEIISLLLAYTQPHELDEELLHKSLWTQMIREVLKNIDAPHTLLPGLHVLAELLPLPLPIPLPSDKQLQPNYIQRLITERKLWSAHLHPQSTQIARLIETIAPASFPQLSDMLVRVCLQLADLAPNMTLLISKTFSDLLCNEWNTNGNGGGSSGTIAIPTATAQLARLLNFFSRLAVHATLKSSALSILCGKLWDLFQALLTFKELTPIVLKCQLGIQRILESFLDTEISLISPNATTTPEINLASALPPKELIPRIVEALLTNLFNVDVTHEVSTLCVCNLTILTENDITFYHLAAQLKQKSVEFQQWMERLISNSEKVAYNSTSIESLFILLRTLSQIEESRNLDPTIPNRSLKMSNMELAQLIGFNESEADNEKPNLLQRMRVLIDTNNSQIAIPNSTLLDDITKMITDLEETQEDATNAAGEGAGVIAAVTETLDEDSSAPNLEPQLPQTVSIVTQYASRPVNSIYDAADQTQLSMRYWLEALSLDAYSPEDLDTQFERVTCDLNDLASNCLPETTNLATDCKRVLHLSASPQSNRERTPTAPCFRTRRVEVEPTTGRPEKKIYITPVRGRGGYSRPPPTRGDLFRSRPPNTSRPPSLHVDDFLALETCGAQPTGPTGYNKIPPMMRGTRVRGVRGGGRGGLVTAGGYRKPKLLRTASPSTWNDGSSPHYRGGGGETHFGSSDMHMHFGMRIRGRGRGRPYIR